MVPLPQTVPEPSWVEVTARLSVDASTPTRPRNRVGVVPAILEGSDDSISA